MRENAGGFINFGSLETARRIVDGDDWIEVWRKHYRPMKIAGVVVCPEWVDYDNKDNDLVVKINSNNAFTANINTTHFASFKEIITSKFFAAFKL